MTGRSPWLFAASAVALLAVTGCEKAEPAVAVRPEAANPVRPDPAAPAPGTQAAEAIGLDSSSDDVGVPPETPRR